LESYHAFRPQADIEGEQMIEKPALSPNNMGAQPRRFRKEYRNEIQENVSIGGKCYTFKSKLEMRLAEYLQLLKDNGHIKDWWYEQTTFQFPDDKWIIDFDVRANDDTFYYIEAKGHFEARDKRKLTLLAKYKSEVVLWYVFSDNRSRKKMSKRYICICKRVVTISELTKGMI
jgi:hypothetical protein